MATNAPTGELTASGHTRDCPNQAQAGASAGYEDIFCDGCHDWFTEPHILSNGTDIAWPAAWTREQAAAWRQARGLAGTPQAGPHDTPPLANEIATEGTGMLPTPGEANESDMAPGG